LNWAHSFEQREKHGAALKNQTPMGIGGSKEKTEGSERDDGRKGEGEDGLHDKKGMD